MILSHVRTPPAFHWKQSSSSSMVSSRLKEPLEVRELGSEAGSVMETGRRQRDEAEVVMEDVSSSTAHLLAKLSLISVQLRDRECFIPINCLSINGRFFIFLVLRMTSGEIFGQF